MFTIKVFKSKKGNKCYALVYKNSIYVTFDSLTIFKMLGNLTWNEFIELEEGIYEIDC